MAMNLSLASGEGVLEVATGAAVHYVAQGVEQSEDYRSGCRFELDVSTQGDEGTTGSHPNGDHHS